jgi:uncharacterized membrane-anchored protein
LVYGMLCGIVSGLSQPNLPAASVRVAASKIPEVTVWFWITKVLITGANVAWPDYLYRQFGVVLVGGGIGLVFLAILALQFSLRSYNTWTYWLTVVAVSVVGTEVGNGLHTELSLPYLAVAALYLAVLAAVLVTWRASEKTVSPRSICTPRREMFFWAAAMAAFAVGGAVGHLTTRAFQLGFFQQGYLALWAAVTGLTALAWWRSRLNPVLAFWSAFVVTRPLAAAIAQPPRPSICWL